MPTFYHTWVGEHSSDATMLSVSYTDAAYLMGLLGFGECVQYGEFEADEILVRAMLAETFGILPKRRMTIDDAWEQGVFETDYAADCVRKVRKIAEEANRLQLPVCVK